MFRECLKNHSCNLHALIYGIFCIHSGEIYRKFSVFVRVIIHCEEKKAMKSIKMITKAYFFLLFFISFLLILITSFNLVLLATVYLGSFL